MATPTSPQMDASAPSRPSSAGPESPVNHHVAPFKRFKQMYKDRSPSVVESLSSATGYSPDPTAPVISPSAEELAEIRSSKSFKGLEVSELFGKIYFNVLRSLEANPAGNITSFRTIGSCGTVPLTIVSTVPEIADHYHILILNAKLDILIFSNFWKDSYASRKIGDALKELSRRRESSDKRKIVVKIMFDRGSASHVLYPRVKVEEAERVTLGLPAKKDIPNINLEVVNYHNFPLGTLHSKFMVIDRKVAVINSCNIQDNSNLEMMCQFEGPIVESIYEHGILTWGEPIGYPLPSLEAHESSKSSDSEEFPAAVPVVSRTMNDVNEILNKSLKQNTSYQATDDLADRPFMSHVRHSTDLFPMALVNRAPYAPPGNVSINTPQNVAWLSGVEFAESKIYIQTPDLNAPPIMSALVDAVKRGVDVTIVLCLGYNDLGEMLPLQGGHNENIVAKMKEQLTEEEKKRLKVYWYVGRDMTRPIHATKQVRTCHIKLMIVDERIGIQGSGNQDTQSWFHSQETNCMIESQEVCQSWMKQLAANQNSFKHGLGSDIDGVWRDEAGNIAKDSIGVNTGVNAWYRGAFALISGKIGL
ncbi:hypothetical protein TWF694_003255 [Orbilia ellipsospora]|uniref:PLD phosphodiesterase domain-containing protein n=1 Tax=Orbilia ellipsospora TaxID=2528407 RepID=A0AAV9X122_9PEZI